MQVRHFVTRPTICFMTLYEIQYFYRIHSLFWNAEPNKIQHLSGATYIISYMIQENNNKLINSAYALEEVWNLLF